MADLATGQSITRGLAQILARGPCFCRYARFPTVLLTAHFAFCHHPNRQDAMYPLTSAFPKHYCTRPHFTYWFASRTNLDGTCPRSRLTIDPRSPERYEEALHVICKAWKASAGQSGWTLMLSYHVCTDQPALKYSNYLAQCCSSHDNVAVCLRIESNIIVSAPCIGSGRIPTLTLPTR